MTSIRLFLDGLHYSGYTAFSRDQLDDHINATILIDDPVRVPGFINSWRFYANRTTTSLVHLQVWRPIYDFEEVPFVKTIRYDAYSTIDIEI